MARSLPPIVALVVAGLIATSTTGWTRISGSNFAGERSGNLAPGGQNALLWNDPIATRAMDAELATVDPAKRRAAFRIEQQRFAVDVPSIVLYYRREPFVYVSGLRGFTASPVISPFWNPQDYSL